MKKRVHLVSLGCNKNLIDSEVMLGKLKEYEITSDPKSADVIIINTCGFIEAAKEESLNTIFSLNEERKKDSLLVVSGCLSQRYKDELIKELPEVDLFTGVGDYHRIDEIIKERKNLFSDSTYLIKDEDRVVSNSNSFAYIKLSEGCNQTCSFCAIPGFKGRLKSRELNHIKKEVQNLVNRGFFDFSFISQDSSSYLRDKKEQDGLIKLIDEMEKIEGIRSARILYLYPTTTSDALIERIFKSPLFHNYFDIPLQHINDDMLKRMRRGANKKRVLELLNRIKEKEESFLRTGFIIGHPGESEEAFEELCRFVDDFEFDRISIFAYSDEEDTLSSTMKDKIPQEIIEKRLDIISKIVEKKHLQSLQKMVGRTRTVIAEKPSSEHEYLIGARDLVWDKDIDGEILINDSEIDMISFDKIYEAKITRLVGDKLLATVTKAL